MIQKISCILLFSVCGMLSANSGVRAIQPAYWHCVNNGGIMDPRTDDKGNEYGICMWENKGAHSECGQWAYFRGTCQPDTCALWDHISAKCEKHLDASN